MADGLAPAIDKVGEPAPGAPEAEAGAPAVPTINKPEEPQITPEETKVAGLDGAGPRVGLGLPKPVEVMSVPETPINGNTPAGGTPRPVLNTFEEPTSAPMEPEPVIMTGVETPAATATESKPEASVTEAKPAASTAESKPETSAIVEPAAADAPVAAVNGTAAPAAAAATVTSAPTEAAATKTQPGTDTVDETAMADADAAAAGDKKRKLDEEPAAAPVPAPASSNAPTDKLADASAAATNGTSDEPAEKKMKTSHDEAAESAPATNGKATKKENKKVAPPAIGKTARKTRSQGPVEV